MRTSQQPSSPVRPSAPGVSGRCLRQGDATSVAELRGGPQLDNSDCPTLTEDPAASPDAADLISPTDGMGAVVWLVGSIVVVALVTSVWAVLS